MQAPFPTSTDCIAFQSNIMAVNRLSFRCRLIDLSGCLHRRRIAGTFQAPTRFVRSVSIRWLPRMPLKMKRHGIQKSLKRRTTGLCDACVCSYNHLQWCGVTRASKRYVPCRSASTFASGEEPKTFVWVNARYGACETKTALLLRVGHMRCGCTMQGRIPTTTGRRARTNDYGLSRDVKV